MLPRKIKPKLIFFAVILPLGAEFETWMVSFDMTLVAQWVR